MANKAPIFLLLRLQAAAAAAISCCPGGLVLVAVKFRISGCTGMRLAPLHDKGGSHFSSALWYSKNLHLAGSPNSTDLSDLI